AWSIINENMFPGNTKSSVNDIPDMSDKVVLVTTGTAGLGKRLQEFVTLQVLLTKSTQVWITPHDKSKGEGTLWMLKSVNGEDAYLLFMDPANLKSIKAAAEEFVR
ncbi:hypothetical protein BU15DRAFT_33370, partial [Melanogaster broomeanus]